MADDDDDVDSGQAMELPTPEHEHPPKKNVTIETTIADATNEPHVTRDGSDQISPLPTRPT